MKNKTQTPAATACKETGTRKTINGRTVLVVTVAMVLLFGACKREVITPQAAGPDTNGMMRDAGDAALEARIKDFYGQMQTLKANPGAITGVMSADSAELLTEAVYNYYVARNSDEQMVPFYFEFFAPASNGTLSMKDVAISFYRIKDSIMAVYNDVSYGEKKLASFDLEIDDQGPVAKFIGHGNITGGSSPSELTVNTDPPTGKKTFNAAPNHVWYAGLAVGTTQPHYYIGSNGQITFEYYGKGQSTINPTVNPAVLIAPQDLTVPDARSSLRSLGLNNYFGLSVAAAFTVNIQLATYNTNQVVSQLPVTPLPAPYNTLWGMEQVPILFANFNVNTAQSVTDPDAVQKTWLNIALMNFYLSKIPGIIASTIPAGKIGVDFNIGGRYPVNSYNFNNTIGIGSYNYQINYGTPTSIRYPNATTIVGI